jgi:hypothetical protein
MAHVLEEVTAVNERMKFMVPLESGERISDLCREFGILRKTRHKFEQRYLDQSIGLDLGLGYLDQQTMKFAPIAPEESNQRLSLSSRERR